MLICHTFKIISACSMMFVERIICFGELDKAFSFQPTSITFEASPNIKKMKRACIESL